jgi:SAM-dependent methyltransferase
LEPLKPSKSVIGRPYWILRDRLYRTLFPTRYKEAHELSYWESRLASEKTLRNDHYAYFYREFFGLAPTFYRGKTILDIGCGPRGSLEWASEASERIGLDPLAKEYLRMGADKHAMRYIDAPAERMPFSDGYFDVVCTFNSLDHVSDLGAAVSEIRRVLRPGGTLLITVEVDHPPNACEPITIHDVPSLFGDAFELCDLRKFEVGNHDMYAQMKRNARYDESDPNRPAYVAARLVKRPAVRN